MSAPSETIMMYVCAICYVFVQKKVSFAQIFSHARK